MSNNRYRILFVSGLCGLSALVLFAGPVDDARKLFKEGKYEQVIERMRPQVKKTPRDGNATYYLGASLYETGEYSEARPYLEVAESRGVADASRMLTEIALKDYRVEDAAEHLDTWETLVKKKRGATLPDDYDRLSTLTVRFRNMLERTERIEVLDSMTVDSAAFFSHYRLSPEAGMLLGPEVMKDFGGEKPQMVYIPENRGYRLWSAPDSTGRANIYRSYVLDDGTMEAPEVLDNTLGDGGDAAYPFMLADGATLYYASNGENSLGGYDIFMTRSDESGEFLQPQNVGMPYNSPANDYLLAIDEGAGLGWWATDRNAPEGKLTIYIFIPSETRVNVAPDDENIVALARMDDISLTRNPEVDYKSLLHSRMPDNRTAGADAGGDDAVFRIDMGNGKVYCRLEDFKNRNASKAMLDCMAAMSELRRVDETLDALRAEYRKSKSGATAILDAERRQQSLRDRIMTLRNKAISLETKNNK